MKLIAYKGRGKHPWRWRLVARNGRIVADSAEGYAKRRNLMRALDRLQDELFPYLPEVIWQ